MNIDHPVPSQIGQLRNLWKIAFGDTDDFLDLFWGTAFSPHRCLCASQGDTVTGVLYWFDVQWAGQQFAYLYAIATAPEHRGKGICAGLIEEAKTRLARKGYAGLLLVPQDAGLAAMYRKMDFSYCTKNREFSCQAGTVPAKLRHVDGEAYARLRRRLLPPGGALQEEESLRFLAAQALLLAGEDWVCAAYSDGKALRCAELLGNTAVAPGIVKTMGFKEGLFRSPGNGQDFAMGFPLTPDCRFPDYFGLAFD